MADYLRRNWCEDCRHGAVDQACDRNGNAECRFTLIPLKVTKKQALI